MSPEEILELCRKAGAIGTVRHEDYASYVIALATQRRVADVWKEVEAAYMAVDGKLSMANADHRNQGKRLDFAPPQILVNDEDTLTILVTVTSEIYGTRHGIATSRKKNGTRAEKEYFAEVAETSAIGRTLSAMGYGLLPGAGLASAEDMQRVTGTANEGTRATTSTGYNGKGRGNNNGQGTVPVSTSANSTRSSQPVSNNQRNKLIELYIERFGGTEAQALQGLDALFESTFKHPLGSATMPEASQVITQMISQKNDKVPASDPKATTALPPAVAAQLFGPKVPA